ncbi:MAG: nucleotidyltransferase domain-containing protein [Proteobacteria bacterium]|nr:nucleotidyltransferase domain-containing protein [Pseudomonadota bacterium]
MHEKTIEKLLHKAMVDKEILAVMLFGSQARGEATSASDLDICLVLMHRHYDPLRLSRKKLEYLKIGGLDIHVYQQIPLYIRRRILKEGKILFVRDDDALYETAFRTVRAFDDFKHRYDAYLKQVAHAGS